MAHPIRMSMVYMEYDETDESLFIECRFFTDDLTLGIEDELNKKIGEFNWAQKEAQVVDEYINQHIKIGIGNKELNLQPYETFFNKSQRAVFLRYEYKGIKLIAGEKFFVSNDILFKQFQYGQTNVLQIEIPRVAFTMMQSDMDNYEITFTIKE